MQSTCHKEERYGNPCVKVKSEIRNQKSSKVIEYMQSSLPRIGSSVQHLAVWDVCRGVAWCLSSLAIDHVDVTLLAVAVVRTVVSSGAEESGLFTVTTHTKTRDSDAVQGIGLIASSDSRLRSRLSSLSRLSRGSFLAVGLQVDVAGQLGDFGLVVDETRLQADDVLAQLVVFGLDGLERLGQVVVVLDLLFELADISLLALAECALVDVSPSQNY